MTKWERNYPPVFSMFEKISEGTVGFHVREVNGSSYRRPNTDLVARCVEEFLSSAGVQSEPAVPRPIGAPATGGPGSEIMDQVFSLMRPIGISIQLGKFFLGWRARRTAFERRMLMPRLAVVIDGAHIHAQSTPSSDPWDSGSLCALILPELQNCLEELFPALNFQYELYGQGQSVQRFHLRAGNGLRVTDAQVLRILKKLHQESPSLTIHHREGWFGWPKVVTIKSVRRRQPWPSTGGWEGLRRGT